MVFEKNEFKRSIKNYARFSNEQATEVSFNYSDKLLQVVGTDLSLDISQMNDDEVKALVNDIVLDLAYLPNVYHIKTDRHPVTNAILKVTLLSPPTNKVLCKMLRLINTMNVFPCPLSAFKFIEGYTTHGRIFSAYTSTYDDVFQSAIDFIVDNNPQAVKCEVNKDSFCIKTSKDAKTFPYIFFH